MREPPNTVFTWVTVRRIIDDLARINKAANGARSYWCTCR